MSNKKEEYARLMRRSMEDNTQERKTYIKMAMDSLSGAHRASDKEILDKTREIIKDTFRGEVGAKFASLIANGVMLHHINECKDTVQQAWANPQRNIHPPLPHPRPHPQRQVQWADKRS